MLTVVGVRSTRLFEKFSLSSNHSFANQSFRKSESFILISLLCFMFVIMMTCFNLFPNFFKIEKNHSLKNRINREENEIYVSESHKSRRERDFFPQNLTNREENEIYFSKSHKSRREREFSLKIFIIENRKRNENSIFSSERERERSVFLEISRDSRLLLMTGSSQLGLKPKFGRRKKWMVCPAHYISPKSQTN